VSVPPLVILGCGFLGRAVARQVRASGRVVIGTVRTEEAVRVLRSEGIDARVIPALDAERLHALAPTGMDLVVTYPPDGVTDAALTSSALTARHAVYISSTAVYGEARGEVDETTPIDVRLPRAALRFAAETAWRARGAVVLRAAGIYGPGRGIHVRIANGVFRVPGDGSNVVSRIHVDDLATLVLAALERGRPGAVYVAADDTPVPQIEAIRFVCEALGRPMPPSVPLAEASETLRHDRHVRNAAARRDLAWAPRFPSYREGFLDALSVDRQHSREG